MGCTTSTTKNVKEISTSWLWQDLELADVSFKMVFTTPNEPASTPDGVDIANISLIDDDDTETPASSKIRTSSIDESRVSTHVASILATRTATDFTHSRTFLLHSQVLGSTSIFFRTVLTSGVGSDKTRTSRKETGCRWHVSAELDAEDADVVEVVLEFLYTQHLREDLSGSQLLKILKIGDMWQASTLTEAASYMLCGRTTTFPFSLVYSLPAILTKLDAFSAVVAAAEVQLLATFGNALNIIKSPALLQQFLTLPHPALVALLQSPVLETDSEESVILLVSAWCIEPEGKASSAEQLSELHRLIRYGRLSPPYLSGVCDSLNLPQLTRWQLMELFQFRSNSWEKEWLLSKLLNPVTWYSPQRPTPKQHKPEINLNMVITLDQLKALLDTNSVTATASKHIISSAVYAEGYLWTSKLHAQKGGLRFEVAAQGLASIQSMGMGAIIEHGVTKSVICQIHGPTPLDICSYTADVHTWGMGMMMTGEKGHRKDLARLDFWTPYIVDGLVTWSVVVK